MPEIKLYGFLGFLAALFTLTAFFITCSNSSTEMNVVKPFNIICAICGFLIFVFSLIDLDEMLKDFYVILLVCFVFCIPAILAGIAAYDSSESSCSRVEKVDLGRPKANVLPLGSKQQFIDSIGSDQPKKTPGRTQGPETIHWSVLALDITSSIIFSLSSIFYAKDRLFPNGNRPVVPLIPGPAQQRCPTMSEVGTPIRRLSYRSHPPSRAPSRRPSIQASVYTESIRSQKYRTHPGPRNFPTSASYPSFYNCQSLPDELQNQDYPIQDSPFRNYAGHVSLPV